MKENVKKAGDILSCALSEKNGEGGAKKGSAWNILLLAMKMSELSEKWRAVAGEPLASRSAPCACEEKEGMLLITVSVPDQMVLSAARFRKARLERSISPVLGGAPVAVEFKIGPVKPARAGASIPRYRRAPVAVSEGEAEERAEYFKESGLSPELSVAMARVMLLLEKIAKRR